MARGSLREREPEDVVESKATTNQEMPDAMPCGLESKLGSARACTAEELEAKIAAELGMDDDDEDGLVSLELVTAEDLDAVLDDDDN